MVALRGIGLGLRGAMMPSGSSARLHDVPLRITYDGAHGITERNVRIEAVLLERTMTSLNCHDLDIDDKRQFRLHQIQRAEVLPGIQ